MLTLITAVIYVVIIVVMSVRASNRVGALKTHYQTEITRLQDMVLREREALKDHINSNGGNYQDLPHMTMQELASHLEQEFKTACDHGLNEESRWLYVTAYCLSLIGADTRVYLNDNARLRAQQAKEKQASKAAAKGTH